MPRPFTGNTSNGTPSGVVEFVFAKLATQQGTNLAAGDHVKFDTVIASRGNSVILDTTTSYVTTQGAASIGRFTLKGNRTYRLRASVPYVLGSGATGLLAAQWFDATLAANLPGSQLAALVATTATNDIGGGVAESYFQPGRDTLVELRIITGTALSQIGTTGAREPIAWIETL